MNTRTINIRFLVLSFTVALCFLVASLYFCDHFRSSSFAGRATKVQVGDTKDGVRRIMGKPVVKFAHKDGDMFGFNNDYSGDEYWVYGPIFDFENALFPEPPYLFPFRIRFFFAYPDDVYFRFSAENGAVTEIKLPSGAK